MSVLAIGALAKHVSTPASSISNTITQPKNGVHAKHASYATPASNALGNNATKTAGLSKDFISVLSDMKVG